MASEADNRGAFLIQQFYCARMDAPIYARLCQAMHAAGARASAARPLGWVAMEPDRALAQSVIRVRSWPDAPGWAVLATAHAHAAWVDAGCGRLAQGLRCRRGRE